MHDEPNHGAASTLPFTPSLWIRILNAYIYKMRDQVPYPHQNTDTANVFTAHITLIGRTRPVPGRTFVQISQPKIPYGIHTECDFRGHPTGKRRAWWGGQYGTFFLVHFNVYVCLLGTERNLATAYDLSYPDRISIGTSRFFVQFFYVKEAKFNL